MESHFFPRIRTFQVIDECSQRQLLLNASCCRYNPKKWMFYFLVEESHSVHLDWSTEILLHHTSVPLQAGGFI